MKTVTKELLEEITRRLVAEFHPEAIVLFGSHAWGQPTEDSDVDLLVVMPGRVEHPLRESQRAHGCLSGLGIAKDVLVKSRSELERYSHVPASLEAAIVQRGRALYGPAQA